MILATAIALSLYAALCVAVFAGAEQTEAAHLAEMRSLLAGDPELSLPPHTTKV